jgi:hypothetical protein
LPDFSWHSEPKCEKILKSLTKIPNGHKIYQNGKKYQMAMKYANLLHPKAFQKLANFGFLV